MRRVDDTPLDPEIAAQLDAIDATLAGEPVDPQYAELAELALLLRGERPAVDLGFARELDERVARRFADAGPGGVAPASSGKRRFTASWGEWMRPLAGIAAALALVAVVVVIAWPGGGGSSSASSSSAASAPATTAASGLRHPSAGAQKAASSAASSGAASSSAVASAPAGSSASGSASASAPANVTPVPNGRKIVESAQLALGASAGHIEDVAQEVFDVAGREHAVVNSSNVTAGAGGSGQFQLSVPSSSLAATMTALSQLRYANVVSRSDATQDVNGQYLSDVRKLADARALRTSLLRQLAKATTQEQIDSLNARIRDAEASIRSDEATLATMNHRIDFSQVSVDINGSAVPVGSGQRGGHSGSSFTLGKAAHDAGRVLTVAGGVALIMLAALAPVALIGALAWWIWSVLRRRRREHALDLA